MATPSITYDENTPWVPTYAMWQDAGIAQAVLDGSDLNATFSKSPNHPGCSIRRVDHASHSPWVVIQSTKKDPWFDTRSIILPSPELISDWESFASHLKKFLHESVQVEDVIIGFYGKANEETRRLGSGAGPGTNPLTTESRQQRADAKATEEFERMSKPKTSRQKKAWSKHLEY